MPPARDIPFGAIAPYLPSVEQIGDVLPMLVIARRALVELAGDRPLILVVDDAPLLDDASALVIGQAVAAGDARLLATQREGAPLPDPIRRLAVPRLVVGPLDRATTISIAESIVGRTIAAATAERIFRLSGGNPLHLHELVLAALEARAWIDGPDGASLPEHVGAPPRLTELVDARLRGLPDDAVEAVTLLALGEPHRRHPTARARSAQARRRHVDMVATDGSTVVSSRYGVLCVAATDSCDAGASDTGCIEAADQRDPGSRGAGRDTRPPRAGRNRRGP